MTRCVIKVGKNTRGHREVLESKGYEVTEEDGNYVINVDGPIVTDTVNLNTDEGKTLIRDTIEQKGCFTYKTPFVLPGTEEARSGLFVVAKLGQLSAFVMKPKKNKTASSAISQDLVDDLLG